MTSAVSLRNCYPIGINTYASISFYELLSNNNLENISQIIDPGDVRIFSPADLFASTNLCTQNYDQKSSELMQLRHSFFLSFCFNLSFSPFFLMQYSYVRSLLALFKVSRFILLLLLLLSSASDLFSQISPLSSWLAGQALGTHVPVLFTNSGIICLEIYALSFFPPNFVRSPSPGNRARRDYLFRI